MIAFLRRRQPPVDLLTATKAGIGGLLAIGIVAAVSELSGSAWLMAPFGATCVLLFSVPGSPLSQPVNVVGGHVVSTAIGLAILALLPPTWWSMALAVGLAITAMAALRVTHPPAGADPLVVLAAAPGIEFLLFPAIAGSVLLVAIAIVFHKLPPTTTYPTAD